MAHTVRRFFIGYSKYLLNNNIIYPYGLWPNVVDSLDKNFRINLDKYYYLSLIRRNDNLFSMNIFQIAKCILEILKYWHRLKRPICISFKHNHMERIKGRFNLIVLDNNILSNILTKLDITESHTP